MSWPAETAPDAARTLFALDGRVALVTGASGGLGLEIAAGLASAGAHVLVNSRSADRAARIVEAFAAARLAASPAVFDPADDAAVSAALAEAAARHGRLDILVANAAMRHRATFAKISTDEFRQVLDTNLAAVFGLCRAAMPLLVESGHGRIILIGSVGARVAPFGDTAYIAAKAGIEALARGIAVEFARKRVCCNALVPGSFLTEINRPVAERMGDTITRRTPLGRFGSPGELAGAAIFLASDAASYVTGHALVVDGGMTVSI